MAQAARGKRTKEIVFVMVMNGTRCKKKKEKKDYVCDGGEWDKQQAEKEEKKRLCL